MEITIRHETFQDRSRIARINDFAGKKNGESSLVNKLRKTREFIPELSLIAEINKKPVGHLLLYPVYLVSRKTKYKTLALGPLTLVPEQTNRRIGEMLVNEGIMRSKKMGYFSIIVSGNADYYPKFGFKKASKYNIKSPSKISDNAFMALELVPGALDGVPGKIEYPKPYLKMI